MRETLTWLALLLVSATVIAESRRTRREVLMPPIQPLSAMHSTDVRRYKHDGTQPVAWQDGGQEPVVDVTTAQILGLL